jgi:hypothetical protein
MKKRLFAIATFVVSVVGAPDAFAQDGGAR